MGIFKSIKQANAVIEQARRDVAKPKQDELAARRNANNQGGKR